MSSESHGSGVANLQLAAQITGQTRTVFETLDSLLFEGGSGGRLFPHADKSPEKEAFDEALGAFVLQHINQLDAIPSLPLDIETVSRRDDYFARIFVDKLRWATYQAYKQVHVQDISAKLEGRTLRLSCIGRRTLRMSNDAATWMSDSHPAVGTGKFVSYDPQFARFAIEGPTEDRIYETDLWLREYKGGLTAVTQSTQLEILD